MRYEETEHQLVLSERNLLSLLSKLYTPGSACAIETPCGRLTVLAEKDEAHYGDRAYPPGPMHPVTEALIDVLRQTVATIQ